MSSSRSEFLKGLSARLERDLALREAERQAERDEALVPTAPQIAQPEGGLAPSPGAIAVDQIEDVFAPYAGLSEPEPDAESEAAAPAQRPRGPLDQMIVASASVDGQSPAERSTPPVSWSETGMPSRLRDAIASVRRISHELYQAPGDDAAMLAPRALRDHVGQDGFSPDSPAPSDTPAEDRLAGRQDDAAYEHEPIRFDITKDYEDDRIRFDDKIELQDTSADLVLRDDAAAYEDPGADPAPEDAAAAQGEPDAEAEFGDAAGAPIWPDQPTTYPTPGPVDRAAYQPIRPDPARQTEPALGNQDFHVAGLAGEGGGEEPEPGLREEPELGFAERPEPGLGEEPEGHPPVHHGTTGGRGIHVTAFAVAVAFVALAGLGLGLLSGGGGSEERSPAQHPPTAAPVPAQPGAVLAELPPPTQQSELTTVRVAPAPGAALAEPAPATQVSNSALPLPPPPKPVLRQTAADQPPPDEPQADAAPAAVDGEDAGDVFRPLFAKLPASVAARDEVLVLYMATAAGAPATAMHLIRQLKAEGFPVEARPVQFPIATNSIRYFFASDRDQAEALRASLASQMPGGAEVLVMDFTAYEPKPQQGHLEVWLRP